MDQFSVEPITKIKKPILFNIFLEQRYIHVAWQKNTSGANGGPQAVHFSNIHFSLQNSLAPRDDLPGASDIVWMFNYRFQLNE